MLRYRTISEQILPVLEHTRAAVAAGAPLRDALHAAMHSVAETTGVSYQTIEDGCRRRLDLRDARQFRRLLAAWFESGSSDLMTLLLSKADPAAHTEIRAFFAPGAGAQEPLAHAGNAFREDGQAFETGGVAAETGTIVIRDLDGETLDLLRRRADVHGRSIEAEAKAILTQAVRADRREFATWAAGFRSRLGDRYKGDVTADIRRDRNR